MSKKNASAIVSGARLLSGLFQDLVQAVKEAGGTDEDIYCLATPEGKKTMGEIAKVIVGKPVFPSLSLAPDLIPEYTDSDGKKRKWEVVEDVAPTLKSVSDLNLIGFLNNSESYISGEKMRQRAKMLNAYLGLADAKFMLDHQADIPVKMGRYYIVFPGTLLRSPDGYLCVAFLYWSGGGWVVCFSWLVGWGGGDRLARCK